MTSIAAGDEAELGPAAENTGRRRAAQLQSWKLLVATSIAAGLGLVMILLKDLVLTHLH